MFEVIKILALPICLLSSAVLYAASPSPYSGQELREIKSLSPSEQEDLLAGKGMGLAKTAELNGYPGPAHVLELANEIALSEEQRVETEAIFNAMQAKAQALGRQLVEAEQSLDARFASKQITAAELAESLAKIGALQSQLRAAHLQAHLEQARILSASQTARYNELRGYAASNAHSHHAH